MALVIEEEGRHLYQGLVLDPFQLEAVSYIDQHLSVLVSAPTGVGKTLIADYVIEKCHGEGRQVIYTAPIKALSNQKYKDFKGKFGEDAVGIITGDIVINSNAAVLVMTTEIFRNMLLTNDPIIDQVDYLIFDEIHYISDAERGSVWEESIIFMPEHIRLLGLSATIPNVEELASWIANIRKQEVKVVRHFHRAVPLKHFVFEKNMGLGTVKDALKIRKRMLEDLPEQEGIPGKKTNLVATNHIDLIDYIKDRYLPCLFFVFSRKKCEEYAFELARTHNFLTPEQRAAVEQVIKTKLDSHVVKANQAAINRVHRVLVKGIGYHHAGMLAIVKDVVEELLAQRLIKVLYCTETFAVGINMPVRTVCFDSNEKYDGKEFRLMSNQEYFQMAGRAGRRGIDEEGFVFSVADINYLEPEKMIKPDENKLEDLRSQFNLGYNSVVNLVQSHQTEEEIENILKNNFAYYQVNSERRLIEERLNQVEKQLKSLVSRRCDQVFSPECIIQSQRLKRMLKEDKGQLARLSGPRGRYKRNKDKKKHLLNRIKQNENLLASAQLRQCSPEQVSDCREQKSAYARLEEEKNALTKRYSELKKATNFLDDFRIKRQLLTELGFVENTHELTPRGRFATKIYVQELLVSELYFDGVFHEFDHDQINALVAGIGYEGRKNEWFRKGTVYDLERVKRVLRPIAYAEYRFGQPDSILFHPEVALMAYQWSAGDRFEDLRHYCNLQDGDIVSVFRRTIDLLRQIRSAADADKALVTKLSECIKKLDRDVVEVNL